MYKLTIERTEPNPNYEEEKKQWKENYGQYGVARGSVEGPRMEKVIKFLEVMVSDEEFEAIKKSVLAGM